MSGPEPAGRDPRRDGGAMAGRRRTRERLVALLVAGAVALNFPFLSIFRGGELLAGVPALFLYLFLVWLLLAVGTALALGARPPGARGDGGRGGPPEP